MQIINRIFITFIICLTSQIIYGQEFEFMYGDSMRSYVVYEPELEQNENGWPLVIGLHGTSADGAIFIGVTNLVSKANEAKFITACPNGLNYGRYTYFNAGGGYEELTHGTDDLGFISALIDTMVKNYNIDTTRIYVMGFSNGSLMAYRLAAELSHRIAAIGVVAGAMLLESCNPEYPVPIIHFHGLKDTRVPYEGAGDSILVIPPVDSTLAIWREINNCSSIPDTIYNDSGIIAQKWASPGDISDMILYTYTEGEHDWPKLVNWGIRATDLIWDFLENQTKNIASSIEEDYAHSIPTNFTLYQNTPNPFNPSTTIRYSIDKPGNISLKVYNLSGQEIKTLVDAFQPEGDYAVTWQPEGLPSGLYFYSIQTGKYSETRKLILQK